MPFRSKKLRSLIKLHHELNWCEIAREALRKKMRSHGMLKELAKAKGLTVRQALEIDGAVKEAVAGKKRRLTHGEEEGD